MKSRRVAERCLVLFVLGVPVALVGQSQSGRPTSQRAPSEGRAPTGTPLVPLEESWLRWPLPVSEQAYTTIDGRRLKGYVKEITAISRRSRDRGEQWWGRIQGMPADAETQEWLADKFRRAGIQDVRVQPFDLPPQWHPMSWSATASANGTIVRLESVMPWTTAVSGTLDLEAVYVGLGAEADFAPRDVKGKAVFIYGAPEPGLWTSSAIHDGALQRADQRGAAAVFLAIGLPGNMKMHAFRGAVKAPAYSIGFDDFVSVRQMIERAGSGPAARVKVTLDLKTIPGLKSANVWGVIPGMSDEKVIVSAHRDGYFEGAADNASGLATLVGLAEYFTGLPKEKRPRTIMLVGTPGHHGTQDLGLKWIQEHRDTDLGKVALYINGEHTAAGQTYLRGPVIRKANAANAFWWSLEGSPKLQSIVLNAYRTFGVATYAEPETGSPPGATGDYGDIATVGLVDAGIFYHTEGETEDTIPPFGLEASTRAFAKIIDESGTVEIAALKKAAATTRR
jgi:peptidase M28-like protein